MREQLDLKTKRACDLQAALADAAATMAEQIPQVEVAQQRSANAAALAREVELDLLRAHLLLDGCSASADEGSGADGAAATHSMTARMEAAGRLLNNFALVLKDVTNPSPSTNVFGTPLTQRELSRVSPEHTPYADAALREVARRLMGSRPGLEELRETLERENEAQAVAWAGTARYLSARIQARPEEKAGRAPDMSEAAAAAMRAVLREVAPTCAGNEPVGGATTSLLLTTHHMHARGEAARKLLANFERVHLDVTNASPTHNIDGAPLTQLRG